MQLPPLGFMDISLLLALGAIVFVATVELTAPHHGLTNLTINRRKLRNVSIVISTLFIFTVAIRVAGVLFPIG